jgi:RHS repeat-associated protein
LTYNFNLGNGATGTDNGNVIQIANGKDPARTQNFTYDALNRIQQAYTNGPNWGETFGPLATLPGVAPATPGIDAWGNLTNRSGVTGKTLTEALSCPASANNQLTTCFTYDAAGNLIKNGTATYTYDAENRIITTAGTSYIYDGDGQRIEKCTAGATAGTCSSIATGTYYWKQGDGGTIAETDLHGNWTAAYGIIRGKIASRVDLPANTLHYYFNDHLGTTSVVTSAAGVVQKESDYFPYGGEIAIVSGDANRYKFTGKERDSESGLDMFGARYYGSSLGRFMTPDPLYLELRRLGDPQQLNLYSYTRNNPLKFIDATGLDVTCSGDRCDDNLKALQKDTSFKVAMDKNGKIGTEGDIDIKHLSKSEKQLLKAIGDTKHHVSINAIGGAKDSSVFFGASHGASHTIAFDQTALLDTAKNAGGMTSAQLVGHEIVEGYAESKGTSLKNAHNFADRFFPGFDDPIGASPGARTATDLLSIYLLYPIHGTGVTENIEVKFNTPIPIQAINDKTAQRTPGFPVDVEKQR